MFDYGNQQVLDARKLKKNYYFKRRSFSFKILVSTCSDSNRFFTYILVYSHKNQTMNFEVMIVLLDEFKVKGIEYKCIMCLI